MVPNIHQLQAPSHVIHYWEQATYRRISQCGMFACHTCIHTYIHTYIHIYMHAYIYTYIHTCIHTYIHTYIHIYIYTCMHTYMHTYIHTYVRMYVCTYIHQLRRFYFWSKYFSLPLFQLLVFKPWTYNVCIRKPTLLFMALIHEWPSTYYMVKIIFRRVPSPMIIYSTHKLYLQIHRQVKFLLWVAHKMYGSVTRVSCK